MSTSLLHRAQKVLADHRAAASALALAVPLAATAAANADIATFSSAESTLTYFSNEGYGGSWNSFDGLNSTVGSAGLPDGIKTYGTGLEPNSDSGNRALTLSGSQYRGTPDENGASVRLTIYGTASLNAFQWDSATMSILTTFNFGESHSGGTLDIAYVTTSFAAFLPLFEGVGGVGSSGFSALGLEPGGTGWGFQYVDNFGEDPVIQSINWEVVIGLHWTGFQNEDSLGVDIPFNSIDIEIVPAPSAAALATLGLLVAGRRRRHAPAPRTSPGRHPPSRVIP